MILALGAVTGWAIIATAAWAVERHYRRQEKAMTLDWCHRLREQIREVHPNAEE